MNKLSNTIALVDNDISYTSGVRIGENTRTRVNERFLYLRSRNKYIVSEIKKAYKNKDSKARLRLAVMFSISRQAIDSIYNKNK